LVRRTPLLVLLCTGIVAVPVALSCVIPRNLQEQLQLAGDEVVFGTVTSFEEAWAPDVEGQEVAWTKVRFQAQQSLITGRQNFEVELYFRGSILPGGESTTITPSSEDIQVGQQLLLFLAKRPLGVATFGEDYYQLDSYAECYRVMTVRSRRGERVIVQGKGGGFAFPENLRFEDAREAIAKADANRRKR